MTANPKLCAIVAKAKNGVIGLDGDLPWKLSSDLKFFKRATMGKPCMMGRVTWESLPFPLPGRPNLVLTRDRTFRAKGADVFHDIHDMVGRGFELAGGLGTEEIMLIGGAQLYKRLLPLCDRLYVTEVDAEIAGDAFFPEISSHEWGVTSEEKRAKGEKDDYPFVIRQYDRKTAT